METIELSVPFQPDPRAAGSLQVARVDLNWGAQSIVIELIHPDTGIRLTAHYDGDIAVQLMTALNKVDLSVKSLHRRILERLVADGKLSGTIGGAPD